MITAVVRLSLLNSPHATRDWLCPPVLRAGFSPRDEILAPGREVFHMRPNRLRFPVGSGYRSPVVPSRSSVSVSESPACPGHSPGRRPPVPLNVFLGDYRVEWQHRVPFNEETGDFCVEWQFLLLLGGYSVVRGSQKRPFSNDSQLRIRRRVCGCRCSTATQRNNGRKSR